MGSGCLFGIIGGIISLVLFGDFFSGCLIGILLGDLLSGLFRRVRKEDDDTTDEDSGDGYQQSADGRKRVINDIMQVCASVMNADGNVSKAELNEVKHFLLSSFSEEECRYALLQLRDYVKVGNVNIAQSAVELSVYLSHDSKISLVHLLCKIAIADGVFTQYEMSTIQRVSGMVGVSGLELQSILSAYSRHSGGSYSQSGGGSGGTSGGKMSLTTAYSTLGIERSASDSDVKKAYYKLAKQWHPDKFESSSEKQKGAATEKFKKINEAYEVIKDARGIS